MVAIMAPRLSGSIHPGCLRWLHPLLLLRRLREQRTADILWNRATHNNMYVFHHGKLDIFSTHRMNIISGETPFVIVKAEICYFTLIPQQLGSESLGNEHTTYISSWITQRCTTNCDGMGILLATRLCELSKSRSAILSNRCNPSAFDASAPIRIVQIKYSIEGIYAPGGHHIPRICRVSPSKFVPHPFPFLVTPVLRVFRLCAILLRKTSPRLDLVFCLYHVCLRLKAFLRKLQLLSPKGLRQIPLLSRLR